MVSFLLTAEERDRFADWLENFAEVEAAMAVQLEQLGGMLEKSLAQKARVESMAATVIAKRLRNTEDG